MVGWTVFIIALPCAYILYTRYQKRLRALSASSLRDKVIVVTGGASGIGAELSERLVCNEGANVLIWDRDKEQLDRVKERIEGQLEELKKKNLTQSQQETRKRVQCFPVDVTDEKQVESLVDLTERLGQPIDVMVNNAGVAVHKNFLECSRDELRTTMAVNVDSHFTILRCVLPNMLKRHQGHIVQISSMMDSLSCPKLAAYVASKWAVSGFTESLREELSATDTGIDVTLVRPWIVGGTPMFGTVNYWTHWARFFLPPTTRQQVAQSIVEGIKAKDAVVTIPGHMHVLSIVYQLLPSNIRTYLIHTLGLNNLIC